MLELEHAVAPSPPDLHATRCAADSFVGIVAPAKTIAINNERTQAGFPMSAYLGREFNGMRVAYLFAFDSLTQLHPCSLQHA